MHKLNISSMKFNEGLGGELHFKKMDPCITFFVQIIAWCILFEPFVFNLMMYHRAIPTAFIHEIKLCSLFFSCSHFLFCQILRF